MTNLDIFGPDFSGDDFEADSRENGFTYWLASRLAMHLGYETGMSFDKAINKAMTTCNTLNIPIMDNFVQIKHLVDNRELVDFKLSRMACYLVVMNADPKKPAVAKAQKYFADLAGAVHNYLEQAEKVDRVYVRSEITEREHSLSSTAKLAGVENYAYFQNAGYRGMYNRNISELRAYRGIPDNRSPLDYMGKDELAANLFRMTQTELKIKKENLYGQKTLEGAAEQVGRHVRKTMIEISNIAPEKLPKQEDIRQVKSELKATQKQLKKIDKKK